MTLSPAWLCVIDLLLSLDSQYPQGDAANKDDEEKQPS
jgi:hypothetical protein